MIDLTKMDQKDKLLNRVDFKKLDWRKFQDLCADLLTAEGFINVYAGGEGPDRGRDVSAEEDIFSHSGFVERVKWVVQCKHYADSNQPVRATEIAEIQDYLEEHGADGLFIITDTVLTASAVSKIEKFNQTKRHSYRDRFWDNRELVNKLIKNEDILIKYFGESDIVSERKIETTTGAQLPAMPDIIREWGNFKIAKIKLEIVAREKVYLPSYKGSTLRGGFGYAFKRKMCIETEKQCNNCILRESCIYFHLFQSSPSVDMNVKKKVNISRGFILEPPFETKKVYVEGENIVFTLTLVGKAIESLPYIITAFDELGKIGIGKGKGKYLLKEAKCFKNNDCIPIYTEGNKILANNLPLFTIQDILDECKEYKNREKLTIEFLTPTRIKYRGKLTNNLDFHVFVANLLRRIFLLSRYACGKPLGLDYNGLIEKSKKVTITESNLIWYDWERYSKRQDTRMKPRMKLGGFKGNITYCGKLNDFILFILLGSYVHVGKGTVFGLGKYRLYK